MKGWIVFLGALALIIGAVGFVVRDTGDYSSPTATLKTMLEAAKADDRDGVMNCFTDETRDYLKEMEKMAEEMGGGCAQSPNMLSQQYKYAQPVIGAEQITGNRATVEATANGQKELVHLQKEGDDWKITIPELKAAVQMMKGMDGQMQEMMEGMADAMAEAMEEAMEEMGGEMDGEFEEMMWEMQEEMDRQ